MKVGRIPAFQIGGGRLRLAAGLLLVAWVGSVGVLTACSGTQEVREKHGFTVTVEDGVEVALTTGGPRHDGEIFEYEKVLEIRPEPGVEESILYDPSAMTVDGRGNFYVGDHQAGRVAVFDPQGNWVRDIGRPGQGPGEFQNVGALEIVDGTLWASDYSQSRFHRFGLEGEVLETVRVPTSSIIPGVRVNRSFLWVVDDRRVVLGQGQDRRGDVILQKAAMGVADPDGEIDAAVETDWVEQVEYMRYQRDGQQGVAPLAHWYAGFPWGTYGRGRGMYLTTGVEPEISVYGLDGNLRRRIRLDLPPQPVTDEDRAWAIEQMERNLERQLDPEIIDRYHPADPIRYRVMLENPRFAESKAYWYWIDVDDAGYVWLSLDVRQAAVIPDAPRRYRVLSPEGEYLGDTTAPDNVRVARGHFFAMLPDPATGETVPTVYRIRPAVEELDYP